MKLKFFDVFFIIIFDLLDFIIWSFIKFIPGKYVLKFLEKRPLKKRFKIYSKVSKKKIMQRILFLLKNNKKWSLKFSSCLSKSTTVRIIFDFLDLEHVLHFGVFKGTDGNKYAHAWVSQSNSNNFFNLESNIYGIHEVFKL